MSKQKYVYPGEEIGVYAFIFPNNKCYVGMTTRSFEQRWTDHFRAAKGNLHNPYIQSYYNKHKSFKNVEKIILEKWVAPDSLEELIKDFVPLIEEREVFWWEEMNNKGYVMVHGKPTGTGSVFHSDQSKGKISKKVKEAYKSTQPLNDKDIKCFNPNCTNTFIFKKQSIRKKYCSKECKKNDAYNQNHNIVLKCNPEYFINNNLILKKCVVCKNLFKYNKIEKEEFYCSRICSYKKMDLLTYNLLYDLYVNKRMSCEEIANFLPFSISWLAIRNKLLNYEIEIRGHGALPSYFKYKEETKSICPVCSKEFIKNLKVRKTCSRSCGSKLQFL